PKVVQKPHPPLWVGGESHRAIRRAAELGDGWFPLGSNPKFPLRTVSEVERAIGRLHSLAPKAGRQMKGVAIGYIVPALSTGGSSTQNNRLSGEAREVKSSLEEYRRLDVGCREV